MFKYLIKFISMPTLLKYLKANNQERFMTNDFDWRLMLFLKLVGFGYHALQIHSTRMPSGTLRDRRLNKSTKPCCL